MKKVIRLISVILIILLLFYSTKFVNECNQMKDVFNSFVIIKDPNSSKKCSIINETLQGSYEFYNFLDYPLPLWIDIGGHYVYSAFWKAESSLKYVSALGVGPSVNQNAYKCSVWFDYENIISSVSGEFSYKSITWNATIHIYNFICSVKEEEFRGRPYILVIHRLNGDSKKKNHIPIFHKALSTTDSYVNKTAICVLPDTVGIGKAEVIEFISFHLLIGVTDMLLYGNDIHNSIIHKIRPLIGAKTFLRSLSVVPWNFPYDDHALELKLIEIDCAYRTFQLTKAYAVLEWDQYIVPNISKHILDLLHFNNYEFPYSITLGSHICCLENNNDKRSEKSWPIILKKTHCMDFPFNTVLKIHGKDVGGANEIVIRNYSSSICSKTYRSCEGLKNVTTKYHHAPFKFLSGLLSSELLRLWNTGSLF